MNSSTPSDSEEVVDNEIDNESSGENWFMARSNSVGDSDTLLLQLQEFEECLSLANEFEQLSTVSEKLAFFDANRHIFEFPYCTIALCNKIKVYFIFDFLPNVEQPEEVYYYNKWFILNSRKLLKKQDVALRGLPVIDGKELMKLFNLKKAQIHLLDDFVKYEGERVIALCEQAFPSRFETLYSLAVREAQIDISSNVIGPNIWPDLFVWPYVKYIYELKKYNHTKSSEHQQQLLQALRDIKALTEKTKIKKQAPSNLDYTIEELFKNDSSKLKLFIDILTSRGYLTKAGRWNEENKSGVFLPIVEYLKKNKIIKITSSAMLWRIFEKELGPIMSERNFRVTNHQFSLDESLKAALGSLTKQ